MHTQAQPILRIITYQIEQSQYHNIYISSYPYHHHSSKRNPTI